MEYLNNYGSLLEYRNRHRFEQAQHPLALVPTMGNFHKGHLSLIETALEHADKVMISLYVNPTQFNQREDYIRYPRTLESDLEILRSYRDVVVFTPSNEEIYPMGIAMDCRINPPRVANILEGEFRLGHFTGVTTVVAKLLNLTQPQLLILGKKDYQQLRVLEQMVKELRYPCKILGVETVRDETGLAYSSRNLRLNEEERKVAPMIYRQLLWLKEKLSREGRAGFDRLAPTATKTLDSHGFKTEYMQLRTRNNLEYAHSHTNRAVILVAAWLNKVRMIDNLEVTLGTARSD